MMDCSCVYSGSDYADVPSAFTEKTVKARKMYICSECGFEIVPGEHYVKSSGIWDGEPNTYKICMCCKKLRDALFCEGFVFEELYSDLEEHIWETKGEFDSDTLLELPEIVRYRVFNMIDRCWEGLDSYE